MKKKAEEVTDKRLKILGDDEIDALYGLPNFTNEEQTLYFSLSPSEELVMSGLRTFQSRIYFILQLGYFKAQHQFHIFSTAQVKDDAQYVQERYFPLVEFPGDFQVFKDARLDQQGKILDLCRYRPCDLAMKQHLVLKARETARIDSKPIFIFRELMQYLADERRMAPGYSFFQDTIGQALDYENERLVNIVQQHLTDTERQQLAGLVAESDELYEITRLKRNPKGFSIREIAREIQRGKTMRTLYETAQRMLPYLEISNESIKYYAQLVDYYSVFQLTQNDKKLAPVYMLCFILHRYRKVNDNLIIAFMYHVKRYGDETKKAAKERVYEYRLEHNRNLPKAGKVLKLFTDEEPVPETPFESVQTDAFAILEREQLDRMATYLVQEAQFDETAFQWEHIDSINRRFKLRLRPILKSVEWAAWSARHPLLAVVRFLAELFQKDGSLTQTPEQMLPKAFIPKQLNPYLYRTGVENEKHLLVDRYEFLAYRLLRAGLDAGNFFCRDSVRFRSFEDDLVDDERWQDKETLLTTTGLAHLTVPIEEQLAALEQQLEDRLVAVNQRILSGENEYIKTKKRGQEMRWTLSQPRAEETINHPFFDSLPQLDLSSILHFVNKRCGFMGELEHILNRYGKTEADDPVIAACLIAWGTNMGLARMGAISDIDYTTLATMSENFIRLETLQPANDLVSNAIVNLPIFHHYDLGDTLHSSSDGQRFETRIPTFNARHSSKYFGLKKGVVAYTLIANHIPITARIIGADEHESHFVFDVLFNNTTDLQPAVHSTDSAGTNEVNFAILDCFGYQFAPRYKDIFQRVGTGLYGFKHRSQYPANWLIRPVRKINNGLIDDEWDNFQRIMVSLALKTTTQSIIIRKLSSHARKNRTQQALWEYDNIIRSLYLLDYLDSPVLRRNVQYALNRGENYHQLRRAVSYANFGKLRFKTESEQQIWNECSRLITNCIIFYNATLLSNLLIAKEKRGDVQQVALLKHISPVAWQHLNFYGRYTFTTPPEPIDVEALIQSLAHLTIRQYPAE